MPITRRMAIWSAAVLAVTTALAGGSAAVADTAPPAGVPATVSADLMPTVQINGVVWAQATVGSTVIATGDFTRARPAGSPAGANEVARARLLAYDLRTGALMTGFNHSLNGAGRAVAVSPDGSRIYVGGDFTTVDGVAHGRIVAIDAKTGAVVSGFAPSVNGSVRALVATNSTVYAGGAFTAAGSTARTRLAAFSSTGALTSWAPTADAVVTALALTADGSKIVVGGSFSHLSGSTFYGLGAVSPAGGVLPWASSSSSYPIRDYSSGSVGSGITSLSVDANSVYLTGYNYGSISRPGGFEGRAAISPANGAIQWLNDCHGDSYSAVPIGAVLYSVGHPHDCQPAGYFPQTSTPQRALAETLTATHANGPPTNGYSSKQGQPASDQLVWYPTLTAGTYTGQYQAAWSVTGDAQYVSLGGEFLSVNGTSQQGLARFAIRSLATNKIGPTAFSGFAPKVSGTTISFTGTSDRDNASLTYSVYRDDGVSPVWTGTASGTFWKVPRISFVDAGIAAGSTHRYRVVATDPTGNATSSPTVTATTG